MPTFSRTRGGSVTLSGLRSARGQVDIVAVKRLSGPVVGAFQAGQVRSYQLTPGLMGRIRARFGRPHRPEAAGFTAQAGQS
jgi:hypothetical protein